MFQAYDHLETTASLKDSIENIVETKLDNMKQKTPNITRQIVDNLIERSRGDCNKDLYKAFYLKYLNV